MFAAKKLLVGCGLAMAAALVAGTASAQPAMQTITTPDGKEHKIPAGVKVTPEMMEKMRARFGGAPSRPAPAKPDEKKKDESDKKEDDKKKEEDKDKGKDEDKKDEKESEETAEPVTRESTPPKPADPKELEVRPDEETGLVEFSFVNQKWLGVLEWLASISEMSLDWQQLPGDYLNLTTQRAYTVAETRDLVNQRLLVRGYTLLSRDDVLSVVKVDKLDPSMVPRVQPDELEKRDPYEYVKTSFTLDWLLAETAVEELKPMMSTNGKLTALKTTNRLEAMDAVANLRDVHRVLTEEQSTTGQERQFKKFQLVHTAAESVLEQLETLLGLESKSKKGPARPMTPDQMRAAAEAAKRAAAEAKKGGGGPAKPKAEVYLVANKRENSIVAHAPPDKMALIGQAVEALDVASDRAHSLLRNMERMQVYRLESLEPKSLITTLEDLGEFDFDTRLEADEENNAIIAYASLADHLTIRSLIAKLDAGGRRSEVITLETLRAESVAEVIDFMMGGGKEEESQSQSSRSYSPYDRYRGYSSRRSSDEHTDQFRVDADVKGNSLLLWCNDFELAKVEDLLDRLRENRREDSGPNTYEVYHLATLDPELFVTTLEEMETLSFGARLEVDEENSSIIALASEADHVKICDLIEKLDGSGRVFEVIPLRRLEADYVAGTIQSMMGGPTKEQPILDRYSYYPYSSRRRPDSTDDESGFRVDADVEYNRLLLWANEIELEDVMNLLVKLGEIPPEGGDPSTVRVLDVLPGPERERLLERIRRIWPSLAPNELIPPDEEPGEKEEAEEKESDEKQSDEKATPAVARPSTASDGPNSPTRSVFQLARLADETVQPREEVSGDPEVPTKAKEETPQEAKEVVAEEGAKPDAPAEPEKPAAPSADTETESTETPPKPAEPPAPSVAADKPPPPVSITQAPDGRLIITSEDTGALDRLEELIGRMAPPRKDYHWFKLKYAEAYWVTWNLEDFFKEEEEEDGRSSRYNSHYWGYPSSSGSKDTDSRRLSRRRPLRFISDDDTNTILVQGASPDQLATIDDLIEVYDQPPASDSESARKTETFAIRYSKAPVIAEAVKDVYRDLLSDRDKALSNKPQQQQKSESRYSYTYVFGDEDGERKAPKWKGYLSIGIDELSNTLVVSAPEFLFRDISRLIEDLDLAAKPTDAVHVVHLGEGVSAALVQETLSRMLGEKATGGKSSKPSGDKPGGGRPDRPGD